MPDAIVIRSMNPHDVTPEETEEIARAIRGLNLDCDVQASTFERSGKGVTWFEVVHISLLAGVFAGIGKAFGEEVGKKIADVMVDWIRQRFKGRKSASKRPVYVAIYGPDGGVLKSVVVKNAIDEPEDRTEEDNKGIALFRDRQKQQPKGE